MSVEDPPTRRPFVQTAIGCFLRARARVLRSGRYVASVLSSFRCRGGLARAGFILVNLWLVYHLAAVVIAPWSVPPSSRLVQGAWRSVGPYVQLLYLNHGYHYFAP